MYSQGITIEYLNQLHNELSREQTKLVDTMKQTTSVEKEKLYTRQISMLNQLILLVLKFRNLQRQIQLEASY